MLARNRRIVECRRCGAVRTPRWTRDGGGETVGSFPTKGKRKGARIGFSCRNEDRKEREGRRAAPKHKKSDLMDE